MLIRIFDIDWDLDDEIVNLPREVYMEVPNNIDMDEEGADLLSDHFGWCVRGFSWIVEEKGPEPWQKPYSTTAE